MTSERNEYLYNRFGGERISSRQVDELIGLARGVCADGLLNQAEVEFLEKWLAANLGITDNPLTAALYRRVCYCAMQRVNDVRKFVLILVGSRIELIIKSINHSVDFDQS